MLHCLGQIPRASLLFFDLYKNKVTRLLKEWRELFGIDKNIAS